MAFGDFSLRFFEITVGAKISKYLVPAVIFVSFRNLSDGYTESCYVS